MKAKTLKQFVENYSLLKYSLKKFEGYCLKVNGRIDFDQSLEDRSREHQWINGYLWALYDMKKITQEELYSYFDELDNMQRPDDENAEKEGGQADVDIKEEMASVSKENC